MQEGRARAGERLDRSEVDELMQRMEGMLENENGEGFSDDDGVSG